MKKNFICGLDIGTTKLCATCGMVDRSGKINILATQTVPAQVIRAGRIIDSKKLSACIKEVCGSLRKMCGIKFKRVYTNIDSPDLRTKVCEKKIIFGTNAEIKKSKIEELINSVICSNLSLDRKVVWMNNIYPEGFINREGKLNIVIVSVLIPAINSFIKCINDAGLILEHSVPSGCAQVLSLVRDSAEDGEKDNVLIDIGAGLTKITLFKGKLLKGMVILPLGAQCITEDIAMKLKVSFDCAEQMKIKYGRAFCEDRLFNQKIIVKDKGVSRIVSLKHLYEIITSKVDYFLQEMKQALLELNYDDGKVSEIIFTGGGSILEGFLERAEKVLGKAVRMGFLYSVNENHIQAQSALYATSIGLIHFGFKNRDNKNFYTKTKFNSFGRIFNQARLLYREYF